MAAPNTPFVWGPGGAALSPASVASQRKIAEALMAKGMDYSPIQHPTQGLARVAQAMLGGYEGYRADKSEREGQSQVAALLSGVAGGTGTPAAPVAMPGAASAVADDATVQPGTTAAPSAPDFGNFSKAIASIESGNRYDALGPQTRTGDRAYGKYQVMGANVGPWTQEVLGKAMTPEQFLRDPDAQEAVFRAKFGGYAQKYGPEGAAKAWFAGEKGMNNPNARDILGTSVSGYAQKFNSQLASLGGAPAAGAPAPVADPAAVPPGQTMAPAPPMQAPPQQVAQAPTVAPAPAGGLSPRAQHLMAAAMSPWATDGQRQVANALLQREMQADAVSTVDLGNAVGVMDKRGNLVRQIPKGEPNKGPEYGVIGKDEFGNEQYGWRDPRTQSVTPFQAPKPESPPTNSPSAAQPELPPPPQGANPKVWRDTVTKSAAEARATLPSDLLTADQTVNEIDQLLKSEGLNSIVGPLDQFRPSWTLGDSGRDALARFNQLKGRAFLSAYGMLKGGGQITEIEGIKAENAMARMDRALSEKDFRQALTDFSDAVREGSKKLRERSGIAPASPATANEPPKAGAARGAPSVGTVMDGFRFKGGNPADQSNWERVR